MAEIKVQSVGEHVVVNPGRFEIVKGQGTTFRFINTSGGSIRMMFLQSGLLQRRSGAKWLAVPKETFVGPVADGSSSAELRLAPAAGEGEYDYVIVHDAAAWTSQAKTVRGGAAAGVAIGGSSPRIIIKPPPTS